MLLLTHLLQQVVLVIAQYWLLPLVMPFFVFWAQFHNTLIRLRFNPIYFMQNYTYFKQSYQEYLKQNI